MLDVVECTTTDDYNWIINKMENNAGIKEVFKYNIDRLKSSSVTTIVTYNNRPIGFIYITHELSDERIGFVDMGIINTKRGYGFGKKALNIFINKTKNLDIFLISETRKDNIVARKILTHYDNIYEKNDLDFYLINHSLEELKDVGLYEQLINHLNSNRISSKALVKSLY